MKNDDLKKLTDLANDLAQSLPPVLLDGDGNFLFRRADDAPFDLLPATEVLRMLTHARRRAEEITAIVGAQSPRKVGKKPEGGESS